MTNISVICVAGLPMLGKQDIHREVVKSNLIDWLAHLCGSATGIHKSQCCGGGNWVQWRVPALSAGKLWSSM